jgi:uncharacterized membrane protein
MTTATQALPAAPSIRRVAMEDPWTWLAAGWRDMWRRPGISLGYGLAFFVISWGLTLALAEFGLYYLILPLAAGFLMLGPMLAMGLYEISRRLEAGEPVRASGIVFVRTRSPAQLAFVGLVLALFMLAWVRIATLIFALFFGLGFPPAAELVQTLFFTANGLVFLIVGTAAGAILAFIAFAISAVSIPRLMAREGEAVGAMLASVEAVRRNPGPMLLWAWLIALFTAVGVATLYVGLIFTFPLIGHATWHAYRALVDEGAG